MRDGEGRYVVLGQPAHPSGISYVLGQVTRAQRLLGRIRAELEYRDIDELLDAGLHEFLDRVQEQVWATADAVADQFFRHELQPDLRLNLLQAHGSG